MENNIILYSTNCPKCTILKMKLEQKKVEFKTITDMDTMLAKGFITSPILSVNNENLDFQQAVNWVNNLDKE